MQRSVTAVARLRRHLTAPCAAAILAVSTLLKRSDLPRGLRPPGTMYPPHSLFCARADAEALQISFDPSVVTYRQLLEFFYRMHDATTLNRQGPDVGTQYRSAIFTHGEEQQKIAEQITDKVSKEWYKKPVSTQVIPAGQWWDAEEYHQLYLNKNPAGYECPAQYVDPLLLMTFLRFLAP